MRAIISAIGLLVSISRVANKIKEEDETSEILFIGTDYGLENELVPKAGYNLKKIKAYGLLREVSINNLVRCVKTFLSIFTMNKIIKEFKPDIIIGTGGYICGPTMYAGIVQKIPTVLHESNRISRYGS